MSFLPLTKKISLCEVVFCTLALPAGTVPLSPARGGEPEINEERVKPVECSASCDLLSLALERAGLGTCDLDPRTDLAVANPTFRDLCGIGADEPLTVSRLLITLDPATEDLLRETVRHALQTAEPTSFACRLRPAGVGAGRSPPIDLSGCVGAGGAVRLVAFKRGDDQRSGIGLRSPDEGEAGEVATTQSLVRALIHESQQPLSASAAYLDTAAAMLERSRVPDDVESVLAKARAQLFRAGRINARLRDVVAGREPDKSFFLLRDAIQEACVLLREELQTVEVEVKLELTPGCDRVLADRQQIGEALVDLIRTAAEAMHDLSLRRLTISLRLVEDTALEVHVAHTGRGIVAVKAEDPTGLRATGEAADIPCGVRIASAILEAHGGALRALATPDGDASFCLRLPRFDEEVPDE